MAHAYVGSADTTPYTIAGGLITVLLVFPTLILIIVALLIWRRKRNKQLKLDSNIEANSVLYSTLDRGTYKPGRVQEQPLRDPDGLYDKIELSLTTGQREKTSDIDSEGMCVVPNEMPINKHQEKKDNKDSEEESEKLKNLEEMYAVVNKKKKQKTKGTCVAIDEASNYKEEKEDKEEQNEKHVIENLEGMYAVVNKKKVKELSGKKEAPPVPEHTEESLYTAGLKKSPMID